jgi:hypothetical protein
VAQVALSGVQVEDDFQSELQDTQQGASRGMHPLSGPAIIVASVGKYAQADFDAADGFQDISQTLRDIRCHQRDREGMDP